MFYAIGIAVGLLSPAESLSEAFGVLAAVTITAFVASFKHPFAALAANEWWQKLVLQYEPVMLFGILTPVVWHKAQLAGIMVLASSGLIHMASWNNSSDSRKHRLEQFMLGFATAMPATTRLVAILNGTDRAHEADAIIKALLSGMAPDFGTLDHPLVEAARKEASRL
ncbi:MAG: hypothetical protein AAB410_05410 [Patescibacteria group bacterium]